MISRHVLFPLAYRYNRRKYYYYVNETETRKVFEIVLWIEVFIIPMLRDVYNKIDSNHIIFSGPSSLVSI